MQTPGIDGGTRHEAELGVDSLKWRSIEISVSEAFLRKSPAALG